MNLKNYVMSKQTIADFKDHEPYILLVEDTYCESTGWEKDGEIGAARKFLRVYNLTHNELAVWIIENGDKEKYKVFRAHEVNIERQVEIKVILDPQ